MFFLYQVIIGLIFLTCFPFLLIAVLVTGKHRRGLSERLGFVSLSQSRKPITSRIWIHAASIGEVNAARIIIKHLVNLVPNVSFVVTTMTIHGRDYGREKLGEDIPCFLAPLDIPLIVDWFIHVLNPDAYVCLETELWPITIGKTKRSGAATVLLNGRISDKSVSGYQRFRFIFKSVLRDFDEIGAISNVDLERFVLLGAKPEAISVTGNIKYDAMLPVDHQAIRNNYCDLLQINEETDVFIAGSTHDPEETLLLPIYQKMSEKYNQLWFIAPRHIDRLEQIEKMLNGSGVEYDLLSSCKGGTTRKYSLVLVDTFGDLADLYSVASFVFIGGSFTDYGGHNLMEAAVWGNVLFFGPNIQDFQEAADALLEEGGGVCIQSPGELEELLDNFSADRSLLHEASNKAGKTARKQQNAGVRQAELVIRNL
mgnify:CR=1 FL=1